MRKLWIFLIFLVSYNLNAQPGYYSIYKNINDVTSNEIARIKANGDRYKCTYVIDSTSDLSSLAKLRGLHSINVNILLKAFPKEINLLSDSLTIISINGLGRLSDITELKQLKNLESIEIFGYTGTYVPNFVELKKLSKFRLDDNYLKDISGLVSCNNLNRIEINSQSLTIFPVFPPNNKITALAMSLNKSCTDINSITSLHKLQTLFISNVSIRKFPLGYSSTLKILNLSNWVQLKDISNINELFNLDYLAITNSGLEIFDEKFSNLNIKQLDISDNSHLKKIDGLAKMLSLKQFELSRLDSLKRFDFDISRMNLKKIEIRECKNLKNISGISSSKSLIQLELNDLDSIKSLDFDMGAMNLEELKISGLKNLESLNGISTCKSLKLLELNNIPIRKLPDNMRNMMSLERVFISNMNQLTDIGNLKEVNHLYVFNIQDVNNLAEIPESFSTNSKIEYIYIWFAHNLKLGKGITQLKNLKNLNLRDLNDAFRLPANFFTCQNLQNISIDSRMYDISMIKNLPNLKKLKLSWANFFELPIGLNALEELCIYNNYEISDLSYISNLKKLQTLEIENTSLTILPDLTRIPSLQKVIIRNNKALRIPKEYKQNYNWNVDNNEKK